MDGLDPNLKLFKAWLEIISALVVLVGVPIGLVRYFLAVRREQHDREYGAD